mmetsp:Transcript_16971/g.44043  ORF Transcript_16971/g.44043 Transcript_16971/m.44043 type:complete len:422 (-) Transcript_16971:72-1337(-)
MRGSCCCRLGGLGLGGGLGGGLSVQVGAQQRDARADLGLHGQRGAEEDDRRHDDGHALDDVAHAVRHGRHAAQRVERELVVQVVQQADGEEVAVEGGCANLGDGGLNAGLQPGALEVERAGDAQQGRDQGGPGVDARGAQLLDVLHVLLAQHGAEAKGQVGDHGRVEALPVEAQVGGRRVRDTRHDGDEGGQHGERRDGAHEEVGQRNAEDGLQRLHGVSERDGDGGKGQVGSDVARGVHERWGEDELELILGDGPLKGGLLGADGVGEHAVHGAHDHVHGGHGPGEGEIVENGLVDEVEADVQSVPDRDEAHGDHRGRICGANNLGSSRLEGIEVRCSGGHPGACHGLDLGWCTAGRRGGGHPQGECSAAEGGLAQPCSLEGRAGRQGSATGRSRRGHAHVGRGHRHLGSNCSHYNLRLA